MPTTTMQGLCINANGRRFLEGGWQFVIEQQRG